MGCDTREEITQGAVDPYHLRFDVTNNETDASDVEFTDVVSASFDVQRPDNSVVNWPAQIESVSETVIRLAYAFQAGDLDLLGEYQVKPKLVTAGGGLLFASERRFTVQPEFQED